MADDTAPARSNIHVFRADISLWLGWVIEALPGRYHENRYGSGWFNSPPASVRDGVVFVVVESFTSEFTSVIQRGEYSDTLVSILPSSSTLPSRPIKY